MPERKLTPEKLERAAELREKNWTLEDIAAEVGVSIGCLNWNFLLEGVEPSKPRDLAPVPVEPKEMTRGGHVVRRFTVEEDARLLELAEVHSSATEIGQQLGRRPNSVTGRLLTLARRQAREELAKEKANASGNPVSLA